MGDITKKSYKKKVKRLNILIFAHEICPFSGSECSIGWNTVGSISKFHNLTVIHAKTNQNYSINYQKNITTYLDQSNEIQNVNFIPVSQPSINILLSKINNFSSNYGIGFPFIYQFVYRFWQKKAFKIAKKLVMKKKFHIVHQLTSIHIINPGYGYKLNIPFVWGPTGGLIKLKKTFLKELGSKIRIRETFRNIYIDYVLTFSINMRKALKKAELIYLFSNEDNKIVKPLTNAKLKLQIDTGTFKNEEFKEDFKNEITAIWVGSISDRKCPKILLESLIRTDFKGRRFKLIFVYTGILTKDIEELISSLKNKINVVLKNKISKQEVLTLMSSSSFMIHTSFREAASAVLLEAITKGLPIICHDVSGMALAVNEKSGIKIPLISYKKSIRLFSEAVNKFLENQDILDEKRIATIERANELSWEQKGKIIAKDYIDIYEKYL